LHFVSEIIFGGSTAAAMCVCVQKLSDTKNHKKAIKLSEQILSRVPGHGGLLHAFIQNDVRKRVRTETFSMKALNLHNLDKRDEAWNFAKRGLAADITSHVCKHELVSRREDVARQRRCIQAGT
jgi:hypothetical protein